jgi:L-galactose dehydrogenase
VLGKALIQAPFSRSLFTYSTVEFVFNHILNEISRKDLFIATKVGRYGDNEFDFSAERVTKSVDESLKK